MVLSHKFFWAGSLDYDWFLPQYASKSKWLGNRLPFLYNLLWSNKNLISHPYFFLWKERIWLGFVFRGGGGPKSFLLVAFWIMEKTLFQILTLFFHNHFMYILHILFRWGFSSKTNNWCTHDVCLFRPALSIKFACWFWVQATRGQRTYNSRNK